MKLCVISFVNLLVPMLPYTLLMCRQYSTFDVRVLLSVSNDHHCEP